MKYYRVENKSYFVHSQISRKPLTIFRDRRYGVNLFNSVNGIFFRIVCNMYESIKSWFKIKNETSALFACDCGVRQGMNLSPELFALYLNDIENFFFCQVALKPLILQSLPMTYIYN